MHTHIYTYIPYICHKGIYMCIYGEREAMYWANRHIRLGTLTSWELWGKFRILIIVSGNLLKTQILEFTQD